MTTAAESFSNSRLSERALDRRDVRTLALAALGGALEFYDFVVFVFFAIPLGHLFFPRTPHPGWLYCSCMASLRPVTWRGRSVAS